MAKFGKTWPLAIAAAAILAIVALFLGRGYVFRHAYEPTPTAFPEGATVGEASEVSRKPEGPLAEVIAENLEIPWEIAFLPAPPAGGPDGDLLVTERPGTLRRIGKDRRVYTIEGVEHVGEGGLLGMVLHPRFRENRWVYLYLTTRAGEGLINRVERYHWEGDQLSDKQVIIADIPGAQYHDGGRIAFGPDGHLYITTGDANRPERAQDVNFLGGKILRIRDDGAIPPDNPFGNAVWSYGHRNSQGIAWDDQGRLWATEHGRTTLTLSGFDELNLIEKGKNYGWPVIQGDEGREGMERPVIHSGPDETWAPAGAAFWQGSIFFGGLRGEALYQAKILEDRRVSLQVHFRKGFGRIRAVRLGPASAEASAGKPDGFLYITTSNTDGRGEPRPNDDKIIRINPRLLSPEP